MWREDHLHGDLFSDTPKLGPGLTSTWPPDHLLDEPLDDIEEDQNLNAKFVLSGKQRELLKTGYVKNRLARNDKVLKKRDKVPERIQHLTEDIALLYFQSLLSSEQWQYGIVPEENRTSNTSNYYELADQYDPETGTIDGDVDESQQNRYETPFDSPEDLWEDLIEMPRVTQHVRDDVFFHGDAVFAKETQFGFEIGNIFRLLRPDDYETDFRKRWEYDDEIIGSGVMWGFILAFIGHPKTELEEERRQLSELFELFLELQDTRIEEAERMPSENEIANSQHEEITKEAVEEMGFSPHPIILREVEYHCPPVDEIETKRAASKQVVKDIVEVTPLREVDRLRRSLEQDLETVKERSRPGVDSARNVLEIVWEMHSIINSDASSSEFESGTDCTDDRESEKQDMKISSLSIGEKIDKVQSLVSEVLNRVSDADDTPLWTSEAIVRKDDTAHRGTEWELTTYGTLLCDAAFERGEETAWIYYYALGPEELSLSERKQILENLDEMGLVD